MLLSSLRGVHFCTLLLFRSPSTSLSQARPPGLQPAAGPVAHLGIGALLQPPLFPFPLQPLKLLSDLSGRPPPFHDLRAEARGEDS